MRVTLVNYTQNPEGAMALAASVCYDSKPSLDIVKHCLSAGHDSIAEFADFHFEISGVSRALSHQLVRKRMASYAQRSQRYVSEKGFDYATPQSIKSRADANEEYARCMADIQETYVKLVDMGVPKEDARFILPNATHTVLHMKLNFRSLMDLYNNRGCVRSQWEIRELVQKMRREVEKVSPFLARYLVQKCIKHGYCSEGKKGCGLLPTR